MSYMFELGDETIWSPTNRVGQLYIGMLRATADVLEQPTGLDAVSEDLYDIDLSAFSSLVRRMLSVRTESVHPYMWRLLDGVLPICVAMVERAGGTVIATTEEEAAYLAEVHAMDLPMAA
ncbi:DUF6086 family protein [Streptomyces blastmyceticus]|uniref:Uncharacterized protein n=1 Tax=Streptomyces blastmyceticus TaxID=68180 RepID=A0ABP3HN15_9ACTN